MLDAVKDNLEASTMIVMAAAVADYRPKDVHHQKMKKNGKVMTLDLERTEDILASVTGDKGSRIVVGFAAETESVIANAKKKLAEKRADLIVANDVSSSDGGFDVDTNRIVLVSTEGVTELPLLSKREAAEHIIDAALQIRRSRSV